MFTHFFYILKKRKVPVTITEWLALMEALNEGHIASLDDFYYLFLTYICDRAHKEVSAIKR